MNSQSIFGKKFKSPIQQQNQHEWMNLFSTAELYIKQLKRKNGEPILTSSIKVGFLGFLCGIDSIKNLYSDLIVNGPLNYILTYKFSQDHLELFFAAVRSRLGSNNNPTCLQFEHVYKRLLVHHEISGFNGNVTDLDSTPFLSVSSVQQICPESPIQSPTELDEPLLGLPDQLKSLLHGVSKFKESVIVYIAGYVAKMVMRTVKCSVCVSALVLSDPKILSKYSKSLFVQKSWGNLILPTDDVVSVCLETEKQLVRMLYMDPQSFLQGSKHFHLLVNSVTKTLLTRTH